MNAIKEINSYETICIVKPDLNEDSLAKVIETYQLMLADKGAQNVMTQNRGRRHLKYAMKKFKDGIYIQMNYLNYLKHKTICGVCVLHCILLLNVMKIACCLIIKLMSQK